MALDYSVSHMFACYFLVFMALLSADFIRPLPKVTLSRVRSLHKTHFPVEEIKFIPSSC